ncbi:DUF429 domain-containing protein [Roseofilum reptotaenium CS-1145]|uniref:DUF429 domain-containing protein n=1 Tax=Roseofilum reptotaenium AO1-A TaxID=1925591 RepID=A0A1L9QM41_9CYAN|nr:DUF429 domain-containing protein [Roseofilum reptotaenium]MDB9517267.1 DUF429 domain-containing protein [Roseofilum reptotaenium CS-1145]OJJ20766.1 DUF429 domain-containing protein [Roseofilum reptotaenium AO1-A]
MKFLGIDLGWRSGATGLCCLEWSAGQLHLVDLTTEIDLDRILAWIDRQVPPETPGLIAVDAPTLIPNLTGMRLCDRLTHRYFGKYDAGCYPANQQRPFAERTTGFGESLATRGFSHAPDIMPQKPGRYQIEVYPHPAIVNLFGLERILKYKKGKVGDRRLELSKLRKFIGDRLPQRQPPLAVLHLPDIPETGKALKTVEDQLDSLICAYIGAYWWYWGTEKNWVLGDLSSGYIIVPQPDTPG